MKLPKVLCLCLIVFMISLSACQKNTPDASKGPEPSNQAISGREGNNGGDQTINGGDNQEEGSEASQPTEKPLVPEFTLEANNGKNVSLSDYAGKVVVLNFWASWCPPCKEEMPAFQKLTDELQDSDEVALLMLNQTDGQRETKEKADSYLSDNGYSFLNLYDTGAVGYAIFGISGIPTTVVIDKEGRLSDYVVGMTDYDAVIAMIEGAK